MTHKNPQLFIIAGSNGAGRGAFAEFTAVFEIEKDFKTMTARFFAPEKRV